MDDKQFQVIINGQLAEGADLDQTRQNIARLFKATIEAVAPMFSGKRISVKKNLDQATAKKYQQLIIKAGLKAGVAPMSNAAAATETAAVKSQSAGLADATIAAVGCTMDDRPPPPEANIDTSAYGIDEVGITLDETPPPDQPDIDISAFDIDEVGIILDETPPPNEPDIDISGISMKETGTDLTEYEPVPEATFDLDQLSMAEAGETLVEHTPVPPADIDTGKLEVSEP